VHSPILIGVVGGGTHTRARIADPYGTALVTPQNHKQQTHKMKQGYSRWEK